MAPQVHITHHPPDGPSSTSPRPPVLLLHGWLGTQADLHPLLLDLTSSGHSVLLADLPYHASSLHVAPTTTPDAARSLIAALIPHLKALCSRTIILLGYSQGGRVAFEICVQLASDPIASFSVKALVLLSSAAPPQLSARKASAESEQSLCQKLSSFSSVEDFGKWLRESWYNAPLWAGLQHTAGYPALIARRVDAACVPGQLAAWGTAAVCMGKSSMTIPKLLLQLPVLYLYGELDRKYAGMTDDFAKHCSKLETCIIPNAGHHVLLEGAPQVSGSVLRFIRKTGEEVRVMGIRMHRYVLHLRKKMIVGGQNVAIREGLLVVLESDGGLYGVGDVCPLPGLHDEDIEMCAKELRVFAERVKESNVFSLETFSLDDIESLTRHLSKSTKNGTEFAFMHMMSHHASGSFASFLQTVAKRSFSKAEFPERSQWRHVQVNGVLPRLSSDSLNRAASVLEAMQNTTFGTVKLKVGALPSVQEEGDLVRDAAIAAKTATRILRLDANRAWTKAQFALFCERLGDTRSEIEFIEEPFQAMEDLLNYLNQPVTTKQIPLGLDETIVDVSAVQIEELASSPRCVALVLKPSMIGSLHDTITLSMISTRTKCTTVLSAVFESGVGIACTALLGAAFGDRTSHGLGTYSYLAEDIIAPSFEEQCVNAEGTTISVNRCEEFLEKAALYVAEKGHDLFS